ncbi:MAG: DUF4886 domain-containing protein [Chloroflexota bacterium]
MKFDKLAFRLTACCVVFILFLSINASNSFSLKAAQPTIRVLFIGNSYTFVNNMPKILMNLAAQETKPIEAVSITKGGATLKQHWLEGKALAAIRSGTWDYVVLQEHSTLGSTLVVNNVAQLNAPDDFYTYARLFDQEIKKSGAKTLFFLTWARQNSPQNQAVLNNTYLTIANELHDEVVPVGMAWADALKTRPDLILHQKDMSHPDPDGSYLAACVFFAQLYHKSPVGLTIAPLSTSAGSLASSKRDALFLQQIAWQVVGQQVKNVNPVS